MKIIYSKTLQLTTKHKKQAYSLYCLQWVILYIYICFFPKLGRGQTLRLSRQGILWNVLHDQYLHSNVTENIHQQIWANRRQYQL